MTITFSDSFLIIATLAGPILAVQAQKWIERVRGKGERKFRVFQTLMMTRAQREVQLKRGAYFPQAHADENLARMVIRDSLVKILSGERPIPMSVFIFQFQTRLWLHRNRYRLPF